MHIDAPAARLGNQGGVETVPVAHHIHGMVGKEGLAAVPAKIFFYRAVAADHPVGTAEQGVHPWLFGKQSVGYNDDIHWCCIVL